MPHIQFFTTAGCHLCEQAWEMLVELQLQHVCEPTEISDDEDLVTRYGVRIPVLRSATGEELGWPFDHDSLTRFVANAQEVN